MHNFLRMADDADVGPVPMERVLFDADIFALIASHIASKDVLAVLLSMAC